MPYVIKEDPVIIRDETESNTAMTLLVALLVVAAIALVGYFAWWVPSQSAPSVIDRQTIIRYNDPSPPTIVNPPTVINTPSQPPVIVQGQPGPQGQTGPKGDKGDPGNTDEVVPPDTTGG